MEQIKIELSFLVYQQSIAILFPKCHVKPLKFPNQNDPHINFDSELLSFVRFKN